VPKKGKVLKTTKTQIITTYWPGMNKRAFLVVFMDPCTKKLFFVHFCHVNNIQ